MPVYLQILEFLNLNQGLFDKIIEIIIHTDDVLLTIVSENILFAYVLLFLIIMFETGLIFFPFLPGDGLLFSAGVVAASTDLNVWILLFILIVAAILGNFLNYATGILLGNKFKQSHNFIIKNYFLKYVPRAQEFYDKHGSSALIIGRFLPIVRTYIPFLAGVVKMEFHLFIKNTFIGAVAWISVFLLLGFFIGEIEWVKNNYGLIFLGLIVITIIPMLYSLVKRMIYR